MNTRRTYLTKCYNNTVKEGRDVQLDVLKLGVHLVEHLLGCRLGDEQDGLEVDLTFRAEVDVGRGVGGVL